MTSENRREFYQQLISGSKQVRPLKQLFLLAFFCKKKIIDLPSSQINDHPSGRIWYFSGIYRSEEKYFRFCCVHGKVKVVRNQVYRRSKVVLGVLRVLSTLVVGFSVKKGPILLLKLRKVIVFFCELRKTLFSVLTRKKRTFLLHQEMGHFFAEYPTTQVDNLSTPRTTLLLR